MIYELLGNDRLTDIFFNDMRSLHATDAINVFVTPALHIVCSSIFAIRPQMFVAFPQKPALHALNLNLQSSELAFSPRCASSRHTRSSFG